VQYLFGKLHKTALGKIGKANVSSFSEWRLKGLDYRRFLLLRDEGAGGEEAGLAEGDEGFEEVFHEGGAGAFEGGGEGGELGADGLGLFGEGFGPGVFAGRCEGGGGGAGRLFVGGVEAGLGGGAGGVLKLRAQPPDEAAA
jgi:hypothetical protein